MDDDYDEYDDDERPDRVRGAVVTALVALALVVALIAIGTTILVRSLGLNSAEPTGPVGAAPEATPLPSSALPSPSESGPSSATPSDLDSPSTTEASGGGPIELSVSPVLAKPMERVNLTGTYPGHDNVGLTVQRWEAGGWEDFGVTATVKVGTFETYVMTGRRGDNRFRVYDPDADNGSNPVVVTIQ